MGFLVRILCHRSLNKLWKVLACLFFCYRRNYLSSGYLRGGKQVERAVPFISLDNLFQYIRSSFPMPVCSVFSSIHTTTAFIGGSRYNPIISAALGAKSLSALMHQECCLCNEIPSFSKSSIWHHLRSTILLRANWHPSGNILSAAIRLFFSITTLLNQHLSWACLGEPCSLIRIALPIHNDCVILLPYWDRC